MYDSPSGLFTDSKLSNLPYVHASQLILPPRLPPLAHTFCSAYTHAVLCHSVVHQLPTLISDHTDDAIGGESDYGDDDRWPDNVRRSDPDVEAEETDRSVAKITSSMKQWEQVTGQKQRPSTKKSKQLAPARGFAKIRDIETCHCRSQKCRDQISFDH